MRQTELRGLQQHGPIFLRSFAETLKRRFVRDMWEGKHVNLNTGSDFFVFLDRVLRLQDFPKARTWQEVEQELQRNCHSTCT